MDKNICNGTYYNLNTDTYWKPTEVWNCSVNNESYNHLDFIWMIEKIFWEIDVVNCLKIYHVWRKFDQDVWNTHYHNIASLAIVSKSFECEIFNLKFLNKVSGENMNLETLNFLGSNFTSICVEVNIVLLISYRKMFKWYLNKYDLWIFMK